MIRPFIPSRCTAFGGERFERVELQSSLISGLSFLVIAEGKQGRSRDAVLRPLFSPATQRSNVGFCAYRGGQVPRIW